MNNHKGARLALRSQALLGKRATADGLRVDEAAPAAGVCARTAYKWLRCCRTEGASDLLNRSSQPQSRPALHPAAVVEHMVALRRERRSYRQMAQAHALAASTVGRWMRRLDLDRLAVLEPAAPIRRDEHEAAGDLLHLDIKRLGRLRRPGHRVTGSRRWGKSAGAGWECVHVEWAYARSHDASVQCVQHLDPWLHPHNGHRPHASLSNERRGSASDLDHRVPARAKSMTPSDAYCPSVDMYCASA